MRQRRLDIKAVDRTEGRIVAFEMGMIPGDAGIENGPNNPLATRMERALRGVTFTVTRERVRDALTSLSSHMRYTTLPFGP